MKTQHFANPIKTMEISTICEQVVKLQWSYTYLRSVARKFGPAGLAGWMAGRVVQVAVLRSRACKKSTLAAVWCTFAPKKVLSLQSGALFPEMKRFVCVFER